MQVLLPAIREWFEAKREHLGIFACSDCRLEGWFKGELLVLFTQLLHQGALQKFEREVNTPSHIPGKRLQIDFKLHIDGQTHLCELKALCISQAAGTPRNLRFYFRDDHVGLVRDIRKLDLIKAENKWLMAFVYPAPAPNAWETVVALLPKELQHWRPVNGPTDTTAPVFISLWRPEAVGV